MKVAAPILLAVGLLLIAGSFFVGRAAPTPSEEQEAVYEQAVTDLHGIANQGQSSEEAKAKVEAANQLLKEAEEAALAAEAQGKWLSSLMKIAGLLVIVGGACLHFYVASQE